MSIKPDRRIDPDYADEQINVLRGLITEAIAAKRTELGVESYSEFPKAVIQWIAGGLMAVAVSGIIGCVVMYGELQALRADLSALRTEVNDLKRLVEPRYRGVPDVTPPR